MQPMAKRELRKLLIDADGEVKRVELPDEVDRRLRARLFAKSRSPARSWVWGSGAVVLAVVLAVLIFWRGASSEHLGGFVVSARSTDWAATLTPGGAIEVSAGSCTLTDPVAAEVLSISAPAVIERDVDGLRVLAGTVRFEVQKRKPGAPSARVLVSDGVIEVLGTRFTVVQGDRRGSVTLHEGEIRFHESSGGSRALAPGGSLAWPSAPAPAMNLAPVTAPAAPAEPRPPSKRPLRRPAVEPIVSRDAEDLLAQVDVLRSRALYPEAARYLTYGLTTDLRPGTRERFSYELGAILTYQLNDAKAACAHWADHARRYPSGRYQTEVQQAAAHLSCDGGAR